MKIKETSQKACLKSYLLLTILITIFSSCTNEVPVQLNGKVVHAITGDGLQGVDIKIENVVCSGFTPAICDHIRLKETSDIDGEFGFSFFQDCKTEIFAESNDEETLGKHKRFIYKEIVGRDKDLSCNERPIIQGDDGYYFEITLQPQLYVDIYAVDDPNIELSSFTFNNQVLEIISASHFQKRYKLDLDSFRGELTFTSNYRNPNTTKDIISYDYFESDEIVYEVRY